MKEFSYQGVDRRGHSVTGTTAAENVQEVRAQLEKFGFSNISVKEVGAQVAQKQASAPAADKMGDDYVQRMVDGLIEVSEPATEEEAEEDEWKRAEAYAKIKKRRRRENIGLIITLVILAVVILSYVYDKATEIKAPQPQFIIRSSSQMLSLKNVYLKGDELYFTVFSRDWNGNVRVDFKAWDPFDEVADFGTARLGYIGEHYGANPEKTGAFPLRKNRFYERIEIVVSGDEGK